jgi:hypothetical protein
MLIVVVEAWVVSLIEDGGGRYVCRVDRTPDLPGAKFHSKNLKQAGARFLGTTFCGMQKSLALQPGKHQ